jgi:ubiquinone/menaquinone biosynthesis C-methylase UbiE
VALSQSEVAAFTAFEKAGWEAAADPYHRHWGPLSQQSASAMLDAAHVTAGTRVLDVATGAGYVAATAAARGAIAVGLDFSAAQVVLAQATYPAVTFRQGDAEALPLEDASFDAVVVGFGVNHLPHPERAFGEAFRVLRGGGWFAFTVWAQPSAGTGFGMVLGAIEAYGETSARLPPAPPYFRFADAAEVRPALEAAGFVDIETVVVPQHWQHDTPDQVFDAFNEGAVRATAMLRAQPAGTREKIRLAVREQVERLKQNGRFVVPVPAALSSARKP